MQHITREMVAAIINESERDAFDTHYLEQRLLRIHTRAFAQELLEFCGNNDPLNSFSAALSHWVLRQFEGDIQRAEKVVSTNLAGDPVRNQQWHRINPERPVA